MGAARRATSSPGSPPTSCSPRPPKPKHSSAAGRSTTCSSTPPSPSIKRGPLGATVLARTGAEPVRSEVATERITANDTTGAGDAFDAGFLAAWLGAPEAGRSLPGVAPPGGPGRPPRGQPAAVDRTPGVDPRLSAAPRVGGSGVPQVAVEPGQHPGLSIDPAIGAARVAVHVRLVRDRARIRRSVGAVAGR